MLICIPIVKNCYQRNDDFGFADPPNRFAHPSRGGSVQIHPMQKPLAQKGTIEA